MLLNEYQIILFSKMLQSIENFRKGKLSYFDFVYNLEGMLDNADLQDEGFVKKWYDLWTPLEIFYATKGDNTTIEDVNKDLSNMESFLRNTIIK